jgi:hypothetical protein
LTGVAFSRDGRKLAVSGETLGASPSPQNPALVVVDLEDHRGIQTLRGLDTEIAKSQVRFAANGKRIAALSIDWRVAIWDLPSGNLRYLLDVTPGNTADNAGLALSADGQKFAISVGHEAKLWDFGTGEETTWQLPTGFLDTLAFDATGTKLFLAREESKDWGERRFPHPRVCRGRNLLATPERDLRRPGTKNAFWVKDFCDRRMDYSQVSADGRYFVIPGERNLRDAKGQIVGLERLVKVFESSTGEEIDSRPNGNFLLDSTGTLMQFQLADPPNAPCELREFPSGKVVGSLAQGATALGLQVSAASLDEFGLSLYRNSDKTPRLNLRGDTSCSPGPWTFSRDGSLLAWGNRDGTVTVCHLEEVRQRLAALGFEL